MTKPDTPSIFRGLLFAMQSSLVPPDSKAVEKFKDLIKEIRFAMLTTVAEGGALRSRPMSTLDTEFNGELWFFTEDDSPKVDEVIEEQNVCLAYSAPDKQKYVSVSGTASVVRDKARAKELWTPFAKAWFPAGVDDPHLALLRVRVQSVEYWDSPSSKMVLLYGLAKAIVTGEKPKNIGEHKKITVAPDAETMGS